MKVSFLRAAVILVVLMAFSAPVHAGETSRGATVYVSVYSHIYYGSKEHPFDLATTLSIRNTDPANSITVAAADYYDSRGHLVRKYLAAPVVLKPLASTYLYVREADTTGGSGANFIVRWHAASPANKPIIESIMIGATSGQGISFVCPGYEIKSD